MAIDCAMAIDCVGWRGLEYVPRVIHMISHLTTSGEPEVPKKV